MKKLKVLKLLMFLTAGCSFAAEEDVHPEIGLIQAAREGHLGMVQNNVALGADISFRDLNGSTALGEAAWGGHLEVVKYLVENGADVLMDGPWQYTPVYAAAMEGHLETVEYLVEHGADATIFGECGCTPLYIAIYCGYIDMVEFLIDIAGVDIDAFCHGTIPPLSNFLNFCVDQRLAHNAIPPHVVEACAILIDRGADMDRRGPIGYSSPATLLNAHDWLEEMVMRAVEEVEIRKIPVKSPYKTE